MTCGFDLQLSVPGAVGLWGELAFGVAVFPPERRLIVSKLKNMVWFLLAVVSGGASREG